MKMCKVSEETSYEVFSECLALAKKHFLEVEDQTSKFSPNLNIIKLLIDMNCLRIVTAREGGKLVGYYATSISPNIITSESVAMDVGVYVDEDYRQCGVFCDMVIKMESVLNNAGVVKNLVLFKSRHDPKIAKKFGYVHEENVYMKRLI